MQPMFSMHHQKPSTTSFSTLVLPFTKVPSTLFGSDRLFTPSPTGGLGEDSGGHSLITDLLQAAKSVGNCALVSNGYGSRSPTNVTDLVPSEQCILKCSNFRKHPSEQGGISSTPNQGTGTDSYRVTTYTGDKNYARGCKSSGLALKRRNSTLRGTSCTCRAKFTLRIDHNSFSWSAELDITSTLAILLFLPTR